MSPNTISSLNSRPNQMLLQLLFQDTPMYLNLNMSRIGLSISPAWPRSSLPYLVKNITTIPCCQGHNVGRSLATPYSIPSSIKFQG